MKFTLAEKLLMNNTKQKKIVPGEIITVKADRVMIHDLFAPFVIRKFSEMGYKHVWDPEKVVIVYDHMIPRTFREDSSQHKLTDEFVINQGIRHIHRADGVCHQLMPEKQYVKAGDIVFGTDSHTTTYGSLGAFSTGIGYTEMASVLGTGNLWIKVPQSIKIQIDGKLSAGVYSKDIILSIIGDIKADGATYMAMEFTGNTIDEMSVSSRMTLSNMAVEAGAKVGIIAPNEKVCRFCGLDSTDTQWLFSDEGAVYEKVLRYRAEEFEPVIACPSNVDNVQPVDQLEDIKLDQCYLGSCTNGRLEDLEIAAEILKGKKVADSIRFLVNPASRNVYEEASKKGILTTLIQAGATICAPSCGLCCGRSGGIVCDGQRVLASNNRNFLGRMGSDKAEIYLASPATVAASAIEGKITDPRIYL